MFVRSKSVVVDGIKYTTDDIINKKKCCRKCALSAMAKYKNGTISAQKLFTAVGNTGNDPKKHDMCDYGTMTASEIAEIAGKSVTTIRSRIRKMESNALTPAQVLGYEPMKPYNKSNDRNANKLALIPGPGSWESKHIGMR